MNSELYDLLAKATARVAAMTDAEREEMYFEQRKSWVRGEMMLEHPEMTVEQFEDMWLKNGLGRTGLTVAVQGVYSTLHGPT